MTRLSPRIMRTVLIGAALALSAGQSNAAAAPTYQYRLAAPGVKTAAEPAPAQPAWQVEGVPSFTFGAATNVGSFATPEVSVSMRNGSTAAQTLVLPGFTGAAAGDFSASTDCANVAANATCNVAIQFRPTVPGARSAGLELGGQQRTVSGTGVAVVSDPFFANVAFLMHLDNSFADVKGNSVTQTGGMGISTSESKFGGGSLQAPASQGVLTSQTNIAGINLDSNPNFTVEAWIRPTAFNPNYSSIVGTFQWQTGYRGGWHLASTVNGALFLQGGATPAFVVQTPNNTLTLNTWQHVAVTRNGNVFTLYVNGISRATSTAAVTFATPNFWPNSVRVGNTIGDGGAYATPFHGNIDEVRITPGVTRYTTNFTVPTAAFPNQ